MGDTDILPDPIPSTIITTTTNVMGDVENDNNTNNKNKNNDNDKNDPPSFLQYFLSSNGPPQLIVAGFILVLASGSCIGVVPAVMTDRFARLHYQFEGDDSCDLFLSENKPFECQQGSQEAQDASAVSSLISNVAIFLTSSLMGSISDTRGRKPIMLIGIGCSLFAPLSLVVLQLYPSLHPYWYYAATSLVGIVPWSSVLLSSIADVVPPHWRAPCFGFQIAGFAVGFALSPIFAILLGHVGVSVFAVTLIVMTFGYVLYIIPETLPNDVSNQALRKKEKEYPHSEPLTKRLGYILSRPFMELSIINRNSLFRLLSILAFSSGISLSADQTLLVYYVEDILRFNDQDIALFFIIFGISGVLVQLFLFPPLNDRLGERTILMMAFLAGTFQNALYGLARRKSTIFVAAAVGALLTMAFPTISAIKANNVTAAEQGRIQGALSSLQALASAVGPICMRFIYYQTDDDSYPGAGAMFLVAGGIYVFATIVAAFLPDEANSKRNIVSRSDNPKLIDDYDSSKGGYGSTDATMQ